MKNTFNIYEQKPKIETVINMAAMSLTSLGVIQITSGNLWGYVTILFAGGLEMFKYWGRERDLW